MILPYMHLQFDVTFSENINSHFPEAVFRGGFGYNLKKICCVNKKSECNDCFLKRNCVFAILFYPSIEEKGTKFHNINTIPNPYNLFITHQYGSKRFTVDFILLKPGFNYYSHIIYSFLKMGEEGIGKERMKYKVDYVRNGATKEIIYSSDKNTINPIEPTELNIGAMDKMLFKDKKALNINFISPVRISRKGRFIDNITFFEVVKSILLRLTLLSDCYGTTDINLDIEKLINLSKETSIVSSNLHLQERKRFSTTQESTISMSGLKGEVSYKNVSSDFDTLMNAGSFLGIGKNTTFGCGRFKYNFMEE